MAEYKRLITYAYNYESGQRRQNVGHARVEVSGNDVKIKFDIKVPSLSGKQLTIYFYKRIRGGIQLVSFGEISVVNGIVEQKLSFTSKNLGNTSLSFDEVNGFILYYNSSKSIIADWKDLNLSREDLACVENPITKWVPKEEPEVKFIPIPEEKKEDEKTSEAAGDPGEAYDEEEVQREEESQEVEENPQEENPHVKKFQETGDIQQAGEIRPEEDQQADSALNEEEVINDLRASQAEEVRAEKEIDVVVEENEEGVESAEEIEETEENEAVEGIEAVEEIEAAGELVDAVEARKEEETPITEDAAETKEPQVNENLQGVSASSLNQDRENNKEAAFPWRDAPAASKILGSFPRVYPFEDGEIAECVKIEPKNIGLLPMEFWHLGNNSFLVHSFCNYHHILFAKKQTRTGCLYLLMVPGVYNPREKYMARMFGFEYFKCAKRRNARDGEFGYWYVTVHF